MPRLGSRGGLSARGFGFGAAAASGPSIADYFDIDLWTGTGASRSITTPFAPDMVWIKQRSSTENHALFDTARGATNYLSSNTTSAQTSAAQSLTAFTGSGYDLGTGASLVNTSAATYVGWAFKKAAGFFDVVTWTGNGSNRTISHALGTVPGLILVKDTSATGAWQVYHRSLANTDYMVLNTAAGSATGTTRWNSTTATSSVFSLGTNATVNNSGDSYVAYLFGSDNSASGVVYCGTFTTDGSGDATVTIGWEPQWILYKGTSGAGTPWAMLDTTRGWSASAMNRLVANSSGAEGALGANYARPTSTGFVFENGAIPADEPYVYCAIRKP
jgi:hypothetical protein